MTYVRNSLGDGRHFRGKRNGDGKNFSMVTNPPQDHQYKILRSHATWPAPPKSGFLPFRLQLQLLI